MMRIPSSLISLTTRALAESMEVKVMTHLAKELIRDYDIYQRSGFRQSLVIPQRDAARQIVTDMLQMGLYYYFISLLIAVHTTGCKGRIYPIAYMNDIISQINECGYIYDPENKIFVEDPSVRMTRNWGALIHGQDHHLAFLRFDVVRSSELVRRHPLKVIRSTYADLRKIIEKSIYKRNGRIWIWEGDGGLAAFFYADKSRLATLAGMEIINELFIYNALRNRLSDPIEVRIAVHAGYCRYSKDAEKLMESDVIRETVRIESNFTGPNTMTVSNTVCLKLNASLINGFSHTDVDDSLRYYSYCVRLER